MANYAPTTWVDNVTPVNAANMNHGEAGIAAAVPADAVTAAATRIISNLLLGSDTQPAFKITGDGKHQWGPGGTTAPDTNLYRNAVGKLKTDGELDVGSAVFANIGTAWQTALGGGGSGFASVYFGSALDTVLYRAAAGQLKTDGSVIAVGNLDMLLASGDANSNLRLQRDGTGRPGLFLGPGGATALDTNLYRNAVGALKTDGDFAVGKTMSVNSGLSGQVFFPPYAAATIEFSPSRDTNLYRVAAGSLKTDGLFSTGNNVVANVGLATQVQIGATGGGLAAIQFGSTSDVSLYRATVGQLKTDGLFIAVSAVYSQPTGSGGGFVYNPAAVGGPAFQSIIQGEANPRFLIDSTGKHNFGAGGTTATDTNLYRGGAGMLRTGGEFRADNAIVVDQAATGQKLYFGGQLDTSMYRLAAGSLQTDGAMTVGNTLSVGSTIYANANISLSGTFYLNAQAAAPPGSPTGRFPVYNLSNGALLGYIPIYS